MRDEGTSWYNQQATEAQVKFVGVLWRKALVLIPEDKRERVMPQAVWSPDDPGTKREVSEEIEWLQGVLSRGGLFDEHGNLI